MIITNNTITRISCCKLVVPSNLRNGTNNTMVQCVVRKNNIHTCTNTDKNSLHYDNNGSFNGGRINYPRRKLKRSDRILNSVVSPSTSTATAASAKSPNRNRQEYSLHNTFSRYFTTNAEENLLDKDTNKAIDFKDSEQQQQDEDQELVQTTNADETIEIVVNVPTSITIPGAEKGGKKLAIVYTCTICNTRSMKQFTYRAYHYGVVIIRCPKCLKQHLIADRLGYFQEAHDTENGFDLTTIAKRYGHSYKRITATTATSNDSDGETTSTETTKVSLEDLIGGDKMKELLQQVTERQGEQGQNDINSNHKIDHTKEDTTTSSK